MLRTDRINKRALAAAVRLKAKRAAAAAATAATAAKEAAEAVASMAAAISQNSGQIVDLRKPRKPSKPQSIKEIEQSQERLKQWAKMADNIGLAFLATSITVVVREILDYEVISPAVGGVCAASVVVYSICQSIALRLYSEVDKQNVAKDWIKEK